jgi:catechol 2,3-dioxygenase-like lactoylglutathione lyase family enzyme
MQAHMRVARPSSDLDALLPFYRDGLGFEVVGSFQDHAGFDGLMLGHPGWAYHLEFTRHPAHPAEKAPSPDHLLVFYIPDDVEWQAAVCKMGVCGFEPVPALNPYWDARGKTFEDPDGWRVVLQNAAWP